MRRACYFLFTLMLCSGFTVALGGACGGSTGLTCLEGQFCKLPPAVCDPVAAEGVCTDIPLDCPPTDPGIETVCGCDGVDYDSQCHADLAGVSLSRRGPCDGTCGTVWGFPCNPGEVCEVPFGECYLDIGGQCAPAPTECPDRCRPVCGCNGITYRTPCDALIAGAGSTWGNSLARYGSCGEAHGLRFASADRIEWEPLPGATGYNVYLNGDMLASESSGPACHAPGVQDTMLTLPGIPGLGELWEIEITAQEAHGEGPMGMGSLCGNRQAAQSCSD